jgi:hypothetical protein
MAVCRLVDGCLGKEVYLLAGGCLDMAVFRLVDGCLDMAVFRLVDESPCGVRVLLLLLQVQPQMFRVLVQEYQK